MARSEAFLLGQLGASWFAVRRHLGRRGRGASAAVAPEQQTLLQAGSRPSTPIPAGQAQQEQAEVQSQASLVNFPAFFPDR